AILSGFLGGIGVLEANREYLGARNTRFVIAPGTPLASKPPKWVVAASLVETTRMYARMVAAIEPEWIEAAGEHLVKSTYSEPHWQAQRGFVAAFASTALYGLSLSSQRRINYASVSPLEARQIFVRAALVEGQSEIKAEFLTHNRALLKQVEAVEARIRRRDVLVDEQAQVEFYLRHLPEHIHSTTALLGWLREQRLTVQNLRMTLADLMRRELSEFDPSRYPDEMECGGNRLTLHYKFEPTEVDDGITLTVPEPLLTALDYSQLSWCVPGWRMEKIVEVLRALPKTVRKQFVPVPKFAAQALQEIDAQADLSDGLVRWIAQTSGVPFSVEELHALSIPMHLNPYLRIEDMHGRVVSQGRDLRQLLRGAHAVATPKPVVSVASEKTHILRSWECGDLPIEREVQRNGVRFKVYPALQSHADHVEVVELNNRFHAEQIMRDGVLRLLMLGLPQQYKFLRQQFSTNKELLLMGQGTSAQQSLPDALAERAIRDCFLPEGQSLPRSKHEFAELIERHRAELNEQASKLSSGLLSVFKDRRAVNMTLNKLNAPAFQAAISDIELQLTELLPEHFLKTTPLPWFGCLPRYLKALLRRVERLPGNVVRDTQLMRQVQPYINSYRKLALRKLLQHDELNKLKWMIEEFRVSLFAQELKTIIPVSVKRLNEQLELARKEDG
ncbi:MAG: DUF3418 domain-containing protein, partial [Steroidobacteraceae bacterium]